MYKLYRATRNGPDTRIDPRKQIAFYVHGIGTPTPGQSPGKFKQTFEQMFGGGLSGRIITWLRYPIGSARHKHCEQTEDRPVACAD